MNILGITSPISWNASACIITDGKLKVFIEEERLNEIKHSVNFFPKKSIIKCLEEINLELKDIDYIAVGWDKTINYIFPAVFSILKEGRLDDLKSEIYSTLENEVNIIKLQNWLSRNFDMTKKEIKKKFQFHPHHICHVASSVRFSDFKESLFLSFDGRGEYNSGCIGYFKENKIHVTETIKISQSLGALYSEITSICGFIPHSHEGKLMGLAAYGNINLDLFKGIASLKNDGYKLHPKWRLKIRNRFNRRKFKLEITQTEKDLAATTQFFLEEAIIRKTRKLKNDYQINNICLAGGTFLNCDTNTRIVNDLGFKNIFIQPASNDAGVSIGAAAETYNQKSNNPINKMKHIYLGPCYTDKKIKKLLDEAKINYKPYDENFIVQSLIDGKIIARFSGEMEGGPRALGNRSILANPFYKGMKDKINNQVKHREDWRPFAPSVLSEHCKDLFINYVESPFMLLTLKVNKLGKKYLSEAVHIDDTARIQSVSLDTNKEYYNLINAFYKATGCPGLLNTSFNYNEKPICCTPQQALQTFFSTGIDILILQNFVVVK